MHSYGLLTALYVTFTAALSLGAAIVPGKAFDRFVTIWLENEDFTSLTQNVDYRNLSSQGILLTSYYALTHPSQPNYIASVGGDCFGLDNDNNVQIPENVSTIVDLFDSKGITWKQYMESIPSQGFTGTATTNGSGNEGYVRKHNPLVSFNSITNNQSRSQNIVSFNQFESDLASESLPQWMHMSPNSTDDGHDTGVAYGAAWSRNFLAPLLSSTYFTNRTLILLTLDESATYSDPNRIASLLLGDIPSNLKGTTDDTLYTHYSISSTLEINFGLSNLGRYDVGANVFQIVANITGYRNQDVVDTANIRLNQSYPGYLNSHRKVLLPTPNVELVGAGGQGVLGTIADAWVNGTGCSSFSSPYDGSGKVFDSISPPVYSEVVTGLKASGNTAECAASGTSTSQSDNRRGSCSRKGDFWSLAMLETFTVIWTLK